MTCTWQYSASKSSDTARLCGKEGHPFCTEHQFIADVLEETESVTREICGQRETALTQWRAEISRLRILVERAHDFTPAAFVKRVHELLPELHQASMAAVVYTYVSGLNEVGR
jgi:hypothetical protein